MVNLWPIPVFSDNYVWVLQSDSDATAAVVDPGDGLAVLAAFERRGLEPNAVLLTHHHADHVGGVDELRERYQIPVFGPARESIKEVDRPVAETDTVPLPDLGIELEVIDVPGHTAGHVAYNGPGFVLCGDTLFAGGCGRVFEGTPEQMFASIGKLVALGADTAVYCAHEYTVNNLRFAAEVEPQNDELHQRLAAALELREKDEPTVPSSLAEELRTNPFLRCGQPSVRAAAERFAGTPLGTEVEVFATVRAWKDGWQG
jgi:hydroxyacylglutathione hydrolase